MMKLVFLALKRPNLDYKCSDMNPLLVLLNQAIILEMLRQVPLHLSESTYRGRVSRNVPKYCHVIQKT